MRLFKIHGAGAMRYFPHKLKAGMLKRCMLLLIIVASQLADPLYAQTGTIVTGIIKNEQGEPLAGATISVKGTTTAVVSGEDGKYSIRVPNNKAILGFSFAGMVRIEQAVGARTNLNISLIQDAGALDDVVVVGYGQVRKKDLTGSVGRVSVEDLQKAPVTTVDQALAGRVAGVNVVSGDGQPGDNAQITIRGVGSVTQSSSPLYVIDGFPQEDANFNSINPADVESIEILKDASSTAIYGARGSNGVIIITTKRGKSAKPVLNYTGYYGAQKPIKLMELMSPYEYVKLQNEANPHYANAIFFTKGVTLEDYKNKEAIDWQDLLFEDAPSFQNHFISLSAKVNKTAYTFSGSFGDQQGLIIKSGFKRYQARFTLDQEVTDKIKTGINVNYAYTKSYGQTPSVQSRPIGQVVNDNSWNLMTNLWSFRPVLSSNADDLSFVYEDIVDDNVENGGSSGSRRSNPYIQALNAINDNFNTTINANAYLQYKITKELTFRTTAGVNLTKGENFAFYNSKTNQGSPLTVNGQTYGVNGSYGSSKTYSFLNENTLNYNKTFNADNRLDAVVGATMQQYTNENYGFQSSNLPNEVLGVNGLGQGTPYSVTSGSGLSAIRSYLGRVNYTFKQNYLFTASVRSDGTSKFHPDYRWGYFPTGAFAWKFGNEQFMKKYNFVNDAKLRMSFGATGNNRVSDFAYSSLLTTNTSTNSGSYTTFNNQIVYNLIVSQMANAGLRWEKGIQTDIGLDLTLFNKKVNLEVDAYRKVTSDLLLRANVAYTTGFNNTFVNIGQVSNQGLEFTLNTDNIRKKNFSWTTSFNISFNQNRLEALNSGEEVLLTTRGFNQSMTTPAYIAKVGKPVAQFYGFIYDGNYQLEDFYKVPSGNNGFLYVLKNNMPTYGTSNTIENPSTSTTTPIQPGDPKFKDLNGDGLLNNLDYTTIGNPYPKHFGGINNNFTYKGFDLNIFFQWSYGNQILNNNRIAFEGGTGSVRSTTSSSLTDGYINYNQYATYADRWTLENPSNLYPRVNMHAGGARQYSTRIIEDGSYIRLKTLQIGYNLPQKFLKKAKLSMARIYLSGQNLLTLTKYTGPDPEVSLGTNNLTPGYDYSPYPRTKVITAGMNITL